MKKRDLVGSGLVAATLVLVPVSARAETRLHTMSQYLVSALNAGDVGAIAGALSPKLRERLSDETLSTSIDDCRLRVGPVERTSLPTSGTARYAFFLAYVPDRVLDMIIELDEAGKVLTWIISSGLTAGETLCFIGRNNVEPPAGT